MLIGQPFDDPKYFWGRLSATAPFPYNAAAAAELSQAHRVARARGLDEARVRELIALGTRRGTSSECLGEARVHVLGLNLALDSLK